MAEAAAGRRVSRRRRIIMQWLPSPYVIRQEDMNLRYYLRRPPQNISYRNPRHKSYRPKFIVFLAMDTDSIIEDFYHVNNSARSHVQIIPEIVYCAVLIIERRHFLNPFTPLSGYILLDITGLSHHSQYIQFFLNLNEMLEGPLFIAQDGFTFEFRIILAFIWYYGWQHRQRRNFNFLDARILYRSIFRHSFQDSISDLFWIYRSNYLDRFYHIDSGNQGHLSPTQRVEMLALWFRSSELRLDTFSANMEFIRNCVISNGRRNNMLSRRFNGHQNPSTRC